MSILNSLNKILVLAVLILFPYTLNKVKEINSEDYLVYLNIGQGDSTLVCSKLNICGLIDTGKQNNVIQEIKSYTNNPLEFLILTHPDSDHTLKTIEIINNIGVKMIFFNNTSKATPLIEQILDIDIPVFELKNNNDFTFDNYHFDVLWPEGSTDLSKFESNETSVTLAITNKDKRFFMAGDLGTKIEQEIQSKYNLTDIKISKLSHHGSKNSSSLDFLSKISPDLGIISVGKNSYGHPSKELLTRIDNLKLNILRTDWDGDIKIVIFGEKLEITTQNSKKSYIILN